MGVAETETETDVVVLLKGDAETLFAADLLSQQDCDGEIVVRCVNDAFIEIDPIIVVDDRCENDDAVEIDM